MNRRYRIAMEAKMKYAVLIGMFSITGLWAGPINTYSAVTVDAKTGYAMLYAYYPLVTGCFNERGTMVSDSGGAQWAPFNPSLWLGYAPLRRLELTFALPYYSDFDTSNGFGDPVVQVKYQFMTAPFSAALHVWLSLPVGAENLTSGSYELTVGALATKQLGKVTAYANLYDTFSFPNEGPLISYNGAAEYDFNSVIGGFVELNGIHSAGEDQLGLLPGIAFTIGKSFSIDAGLSIPVWGRNCPAGLTPCGFIGYNF